MKQRATYEGSRDEKISPEFAGRVAIQFGEKTEIVFTQQAALAESLTPT